MAKQVVVLGAGGHARSVIALLQDCGYTVRGIFDRSYQAGSDEQILGVPVVGREEDIPTEVPVVLALGDNKKRGEAFGRFQAQIVEEAIIHPSVTIHASVQMGRANLLFPKSFLNAEAKIGDNNIINSGCIIEHECQIGSNTHISVGSILAGRVSVGSGCFIGAGAIVRDGISICKNVLIGAGGVVVRNLKEPGTYVGNPLKGLR